MSFETDLRTRVLQSPIATRLGNWEGTRAIHWGDRPGGVPLPAIVFNLIDAGIDYTHGGRDDLRITPIQADALAPDYLTAKAIADQLGELLEGAATIGGREFTHGFIELERDVPVVDVRGAQSVYGRTLRLSIYHKE